MHDNITRYMAELSQSMLRMPVDSIVRLADLIFECYRRGGTTLLMGNGGSAATASHFVCDLAKGTRADHVPAVRAVALTDTTALLTAWANDAGYQHIFSQQVAALSRPRDVVIAISASGNSPNVVAALRAARQARATTIALTGPGGGLLARVADLCVTVPGRSIEQIEDAHLAVAHCVAIDLRARLASLAPSPLLSSDQPAGVAGAPLPVR